MGLFRDMGIPARVAKKNPSPLVQDFFFTTCAGIPMSLNSPMQECSIYFYCSTLGNIKNTFEAL
jgi:hypothetical protein